MNRWSVQRRLVFVGALIIAAILAGTALTLRMQRTAAIDAYQTATTNLGNGMSQQTTQSLASVDRALLKIQRITAARLDSTDDKAETVLQSPAIFALLVDQLGRLNDVESLSLVDAQGRTLNSSSGWPAPPTDLSGQDYFNHFKSSDAPMAFVGAPVRNPGSGAWTASLSRRINDSRGRFAGLVVGEISLTELRDFYQLAMPAHRTVYLFRRDGVALVRYPDRPEEIGRKVSNQSLWYALVANGGGAYRGPADFDGTPILASVHPMRNLPFVIEASLNLSDALSEYDRQRPWVIFGCVLAIAGTVMLLRLFGRQYARIEMSELSLARKNAELDLAHQQLKITLASLSQGVSLYDENDRLVLFNERYCELLGFSSAAVRIGMSVGEILNLRAANSSLIGQHLEAVYAVSKERRPHDTILELSDGRIISAHFQPLHSRGWVVTHEDITDRRAAEAKISFLARHDVLTGLANRALFQDRLALAVAQAKRGSGFAVLFLDLDRFKAVNDTFGHAVGDSLLRAVAGRIQEAVRDGDTVARLGGDEFAILQVNVCDPNETDIVARRIVQTLCAPFELDRHRVSIGVSIGIAMAPRDGFDPDHLMKDADRALYRSKHEGRGTWRFFETTLDEVHETVC